MLRKLLAVAVGVSLCAVRAAPAQAATLVARSFPLSGEVRLENHGVTPVPLVIISIKSTAGALNGSPVRWLSVTEHYDAPIAPTPGNGFIDPNGIWTKISSASIELTEGALDADAGSLAPKRAISLGKIWNSAVPFDLQFTATEPNGQPISIFTAVGLDGDYDQNSVVNQLDYSVWRQNFGSTTAINADGNLNGIVDAGDYVIWRNNLGLSLSGAASTAAFGAALPALVTGGAVPEPASAMQFASAIAVLWAYGRRLRRSGKQCDNRSAGSTLSGGRP
jgi:hypothetical protein